MNVHPYEDIEAFAMGALEPGGSQRLLEHADSCPTCAVLLAEAMNSVAGLEPPGNRPLLRQNVAARVYSRPRVVRWAAGVAALAAVIALAVWNYQLQSNRLEVPIAMLVHSHFAHHALRGSPGSAKVIQALDGSWLYLVGDQLKPQSKYYLWESVGGKEREVGQFSTNLRGQAAAYWQQPTAKIEAFVVSTSQQPGAGVELRWP
jgi:hypothetical protein